MREPSSTIKIPLSTHRMLRTVAALTEEKQYEVVHRLLDVEIKQLAKQVKRLAEQGKTKP